VKCVCTLPEEAKFRQLSGENPMPSDVRTAMPRSSRAQEMGNC